MALLWDLQNGDESALDALEANLVGSLLVCPTLLERCLAMGLQPSDFKRATLGQVFGAIVVFCKLHPPEFLEDPAPLDLWALAHHLEQSGAAPPKKWRWLVVLGKITDDPSMDEFNVAHYVRAVVEGKIRRDLEVAERRR